MYENSENMYLKVSKSNIKNAGKGLFAVANF